MGDATAIEWTDATWNPIRGCRRTAPARSKQSGCGDPSGGGCYAERAAARFCGPGQPYEGLITLTANGPRWSGKTRLVAERLADPLRWRKPRRIFVDSMSDLFYEGFTNEQIAAVFGVMAAAPQHTFQVLTKRARRMRKWFEWVAKESRCRGDWTTPHWSIVEDEARETLASAGLTEEAARFPASATGRSWPLPNVWLGVSVENQAAADARGPDLEATPAAVRFWSVEPMLGPIDARRWLGACRCMVEATDGAGQHAGACPATRPRGVDWIIAGCESGPGARSADVAWFRSLRDQCAEAGVPFFLKQAWAEFWPDGAAPPSVPVTAGSGSHRKPGGIIGAPYLDGVQHLAFPSQEKRS